MNELYVILERIGWRWTAVFAVLLVVGLAVQALRRWSGADPDVPARGFEAINPSDDEKQS